MSSLFFHALVHPLVYATLFGVLGEAAKFLDLEQGIVITRQEDHRQEEHTVHSG